MSEPFLGEIKIVAFNFAPRGWALCDGQILPINQNQSLYSLLGTMYGGDGRTSFALPDMRGRASMHRGDSHQIGNKPGQPTHTLSVAEMPSHNHPLHASDADGDQSNPHNTYFSKEDFSGSFVDGYSVQHRQTMNATMIGGAGETRDHNNMMPYLTLNYCIALSGLFPPRN